MEFPVLVYRLGGLHAAPGKQPYTYCQATEETYDALIADGWFPDYASAVAGRVEQKTTPRRGRPRKSEV